MVVTQRDILDISVTPAEPQAAELFFDYTAELLTKAETLRPYAALIIRNGVGEDELEAMVSQDLRKNSPIRHPSFMDPVNQAMREHWEQSPRDARLEVKDLAFKRLLRGEGKPAHIDQRFKLDADMPEAGPLAALLVIDGKMDYGFKTNRKDVFDPKDRDFFLETNKPQPQGMKYLHPPAQPGDVIILTTNTIHFAKSMKKQRLVAAYLSGFQFRDR